MAAIHLCGPAPFIGRFGIGSACGGLIAAHSLVLPARGERPTDLQSHAAFDNLGRAVVAREAADAQGLLRLDVFVFAMAIGLRPIGVVTVAGLFVAFGGVVGLGRNVGFPGQRDRLGAATSLRRWPRGDQNDIGT